tara:strand:- start:11 stop:187 length:177 start_codon:yes stop_codon:yes gene_type:complete
MNKLEEIIQKSMLKQAKDVRSLYFLLTEEAALNLSREICKDILEEAKKDDSLYLELYL